MRFFLLVSSAALVAGCGLVSGLDNLSVTDGNVDADDAGVSDAPLEIGSSCEAGACGAPAGFQPVFFATTQTALCPKAATSNDVVVDPAPSATACTCACNYQPTCLPEPLVYLGGPLCTQSTATGIVLDGGCNVGAGTQPPMRVAVGPFAPTNACTSTLTSAGTVTSTAGRTCSVTSCASCGAPPGMSLCFAQLGDVKCPPSMTKHSIGTSAQISCSSCSACSSTAKCKGTLTIYDDNACTFKVDTFQVDGTCQSTTNVDDLGSFRYAPSVDVGTCTPGTSAAGVSINGQATICCP